jgi:glucose-6-phosphate 1-dehydrogenase
MDGSTTVAQLQEQADASPNPLIEGLERLPVPNTTLVIFGATGDLARRKLLPALYNIAHEGALPERFNLVGVSRRDQSDDDFRAFAREAITEFSRREPSTDVLDGLLSRLRYTGFSFDDAEGYPRLGKIIEELDQEAGRPLNRAYYLSTAPEFFPVIVEQLGEAGLNHAAKREVDVRAIIEKPFGTDLASAQALQATVSKVFRERQVFRIDHYLGKETVQNVMAFRFANYMFEPVWNRNYIDHIQITAAEDLGIGSRAGYYDGAGALRDLVENHMLQLLTLVCMEPPASFEANKVRDEKVKVLQAITPPTPEEIAAHTVRAQYTAGVIGGERVPGYLEEEGVPDDSTTETYAALKLEVHNWRWAGVPIYLRTGKRLSRKVTEIAVQLKPVPHLAFASKGSVGVQPNQLILTMQPNEGVSLSLGAKIPGTQMRIRPVNMEFLYGTSFMSQSPEAYERLILDAMRGDATLFTRNDETLSQWAIIDPILKAWDEDQQPPLQTYEAGTPGPAAAVELIGEGRHWRGL